MLFLHKDKQRSVTVKRSWYASIAAASWWITTSKPLYRHNIKRTSEDVLFYFKITPRISITRSSLFLPLCVLFSLLHFVVAFLLPQVHGKKNTNSIPAASRRMMLLCNYG